MTRTDSKRQETSKSENQISVSRMQHILYVRYACIRESKNAQRKTFLIDHKLKVAETNLIFKKKSIPKILQSMVELRKKGLCICTLFALFTVNIKISHSCVSFFSFHDYMFYSLFSVFHLNGNAHF